MIDARQVVPSVGRTVHYIAYGTPGEGFPAGVRRAAIITEVDESGNPESPIGLAIFNPTGLVFQQHVPPAAWKKMRTGSEDGSWEWPAQQVSGVRYRVSGVRPLTPDT